MYSLEEIKLYHHLQNSFQAFAKLVTTQPDRIAVRSLELSSSNILLTEHTDTVAAWILWQSLFNCDQVSVVANANMRRTYFTSMLIREQLAKIPKMPIFEKMVTRHNQLSLRFLNQSEIMFCSARPDTMRGRAIANLVVDGLEIGSKPMNELLHSIAPTLVMRSSSIIFLVPELK